MERVEEAARRWHQEMPYTSYRFVQVFDFSSEKRDMLDDRAVTLASYIRSLSTFEFTTEQNGLYGHMGAVIVDAALQAGVNYRDVVLPRVKRIIEHHASASTTREFLTQLQAHGAEQLLNFKGKKARLAEQLAVFFNTESVQNEMDLREWLRSPENVARLRQIKGVGDKTVDYLRLMVGEPTTAIDRHILNFLAEAGVGVSGYGDAHRIVSQAAEILGVSITVLDQGIWRYMSEK